MLLTERSAFQAWLRRFQFAHRALEQGGLAPPAGQTHCCRCGDELNDFQSCGYCILCLAEQFGVEQTEAATAVGRAVYAALLSAQDVHPDTLRATVEVVLDECCIWWDLGVADGLASPGGRDCYG